tara:strand:+ start:1433 stop:2140 length:708 start_codon:yes stop_codon:yes gene_type:complete
MGYKVLEDNLTFANINSDKPTVCFLHGWGRSSKDFIHIENEFESIAFDIPGFGKSIPFPRSLSPKKYADYLAGLIPSSVEIIVGHSFGGRIAVHLSQINKYKKIVLIGVPLIKKQNTKKSSSIFEIYKFMNKFKFISNEKLDQIKNKYGSEDYKNANKYLKDTLVMAINDDLKDILSKIDTKVELVWGEDDSEVPLQVGLDSNDIIPNSELTIIPSSGHNVLMSNPQIVIGVIKK